MTHGGWIFQSHNVIGPGEIRDLFLFHSYFCGFFGNLSGAVKKKNAERVYETRSSKKNVQFPELLQKSFPFTIDSPRVVQQCV